MSALVLILILFWYFLPTSIANSRNHNNVWAIFWFNLFFGWSIFGWLAAIVWSATNNRKLS